MMQQSAQTVAQRTQGRQTGALQGIQLFNRKGRLQRVQDRAVEAARFLPRGGGGGSSRHNPALGAQDVGTLRHHRLLRGRTTERSGKTPAGRGSRSSNARKHAWGRGSSAPSSAGKVAA